MADKHIVLYGYGEEKSKMIHEGLEKVLGFDIGFINAEGHEQETVQDIIEKAYNDKHEVRDLKILMFVDFADDDIEKAMDQFPKAKGLKRPIFCTKTDKNLDWKFEDLMDDLMEEELYFQDKDLKKKPKKKKA
jgi:GTP-binding protein EngB required for normal cell division